MAADTNKSASITTLDGTTSQPPAPVQLTAGDGAAAYTKDVSDYVSATASGLGNTSSTYRAIRLPSNCIVKDVQLYTNTQLDSGSALTVDVGTYYSDSTVDGTAPANQGLLISVNTFIANVAFGQAASGGSRISASNINPNLLTSQLWAQVGLASDPGGYIDIVVAVHTAAGTGIAGNIFVKAAIV